MCQRFRIPVSRTKGKFKSPQKTRCHKSHFGHCELRTDASPRSCPEGKIYKWRELSFLLAQKTLRIEPLRFWKPPLISMGHIRKRIYYAAFWNLISAQLNVLFGFSRKNSNRRWVEPECFLNNGAQVGNFHYVCETRRILLQNTLYFFVGPLLYFRILAHDVPEPRKPRGRCIVAG